MITPIVRTQARPANRKMAFPLAATATQATMMEKRPVMNCLPWSRFSLFRHHFHWLQVEVTTHCQAACTYCPHTVYRDSWQSRHLDPALFQRLLPELSRVNLLYLQGWGEPFLHPDFFTLVSLARQRSEERRVGKECRSRWSPYH